MSSSTIPLSRIALGILVGQDRADRLEYGVGNEVFRGDHLQRMPLAV
jgi:hypothetical protein